jgi:hypothetical protein
MPHLQQMSRRIAGITMYTGMSGTPNKLPRSTSHVWALSELHTVDWRLDREQLPHMLSGMETSRSS